MVQNTGMTGKHSIFTGFIAQRHKNTGHASVRITVFMCQNCNDLQNVAMIDLIIILPWLQICSKLYSQYLCLSVSAQENKKVDNTNTLPIRSYSITREDGNVDDCYIKLH